MRGAGAAGGVDVYSGHEPLFRMINGRPAAARVRFWRLSSWSRINFRRRDSGNAIGPGFMWLADDAQLVLKVSNQ